MLKAQAGKELVKLPVVFGLEILSTISVLGLICWLHWISMSQNSVEGSGAPQVLLIALA